jgi:hypothetical protein
MVPQAHPPGDAHSNLNPEMKYKDAIEVVFASIFELIALQLTAEESWMHSCLTLDIVHMLS